MSEDLKCRHGRSCCPEIFDQINRTIFNLQSIKTQLLNRNEKILARCETLESENSKLKEIERKRIDQVSQLVTELHSLSCVVGELRKALEHQHDTMPGCACCLGLAESCDIQRALSIALPARAEAVLKVVEAAKKWEIARRHGLNNLYDRKAQEDFQDAIADLSNRIDAFAALDKEKP